MYIEEKYIMANYLKQLYVVLCIFVTVAECGIHGRKYMTIITMDRCARARCCRKANLAEFRTRALNLQTPKIDV